MKAAPVREGTGSSYTKERRALFVELDSVPVCFLQLVSKGHPLKAVRTLEKKKKTEKKRRRSRKLFPSGRTYLGV